MSPTNEYYWDWIKLNFKTAASDTGYQILPLNKGSQFDLGKLLTDAGITGTEKFPKLKDLQESLQKGNQEDYITLKGHKTIIQANPMEDSLDVFMGNRRINLVLDGEKSYAQLKSLREISLKGLKENLAADSSDYKKRKRFRR